MKVPGIPAPVKVAVDPPGVATAVAHPAEGDDGTSFAAGSVVAGLVRGGSVDGGSVAGSRVSTAAVSMVSLEAVTLGSVALAVGSTVARDDRGLDEPSLEQDAARRPTTTATMTRRRSADVLVLTSRAT